MKPKLFINSTDVADLTGHSQRNARNIMSHIRATLGLAKKQPITIYDFAKVFHIPEQTLYVYINSPKLKMLHFDREALSSLSPEDLKRLEAQTCFINPREFDGIVNIPRVVKPQ